MSHRLELALADAEKGRRILPLHHITDEKVCSCRKGAACKTPGKHPVWHKELLPNGIYSATTDPEVIRKLFEAFPQANLGWAAGKESGFWALDKDGEEGKAMLSRLEAEHGPLPHTPVNITAGGGEHELFAWEAGLLNFVKFAPGLDVRTDGGLIVVRDSGHISGGSYEFDAGAHPDDIPFAPAPSWLTAMIKTAAAKAAKAPALPPGETVGVGRRNGYLFDEAKSLLKRKVAGPALLGALSMVNKAHCDPPLDEDEVAEIADKAAKHRERNRQRAKASDPTPPTDEDAPPVPPRNGRAGLNSYEPLLDAGENAGQNRPVQARTSGGSRINSLNSLNSFQERHWPAPLAKEAYHGLIGRITRSAAPHTEADPAAIHTNLIVMLGNAMGRSPHALVQRTFHHTNLFKVDAGDTSMGGKGTAIDIARDLVKRACGDWAKECITSGLVSGEGLIWQVRDASPKKAGKGKEEEAGDPGVSDKRRLYEETELSGLFKVMSREGNTLSPQLRKAWDSGYLHSGSKNSPAFATGAHISIIGHITPGEMLQHFSATEAANGFGNRFLFNCCRCHQLLPEGGEPILLNDLVDDLHAAMEAARRLTQIERDEKAKYIWGQLYSRLRRRPPGMFGAMTGRAAGQVLRVSVVYAGIDRSPLIRSEHLLAAVAVWQRAEDSARYLFTDRTGHGLADTLRTVMMKQPVGLDRTALSAALGRNVKAEAMNEALAFLDETGLARREKLPGGKKGREVWTACQTDARGGDSLLHQARAAAADFDQGRLKEPPDLNEFNEFNEFNPEEAEVSHEPERF